MVGLTRYSVTDFISEETYKRISRDANVVLSLPLIFLQRLAFCIAWLFGELLTDAYKLENGRLNRGLSAIFRLLMRARRWLATELDPEALNSKDAETRTSDAGSTPFPLRANAMTTKDDCLRVAIELFFSIVDEPSEPKLGEGSEDNHSEEPPTLQLRKNKKGQSKNSSNEPTLAEEARPQ